LSAGAGDKERKVITPELVEEWVRLYNSGQSARAIAQKYGFGKTAVNNHLRKAGVVFRKTVITHDDELAWKEAYEAGRSLQSIADEWHANDETVRIRLLKLGIKMRSVGGRAKVAPGQEAKWAEQYRSGKTIEEIASLDGVGSATVRTHLKKLGVEIRSRSVARTRVTDDLVREWIDGYRSGLSTVQLAERYGFSNVTIGLYLKASGIDVRWGISDSDSSDIANKYLNGASIQELAALFGVSDTSIRNHLMRHGVELREPELRLKFDDEVIEGWAKRYESGEPLSSIAASDGAPSATTIRKRLVEYGVEIREGKNSLTNSSWPEWTIYYYVARAFSGCDVENNLGIKTVEGTFHPDVVLSMDSFVYLEGVSGLYTGTAIEYDGEYWHEVLGNQELDERRARGMREAGFFVMHIKENTAGINSHPSPEIIFCTQERSGCGVGLGYAIKRVLKVLGVQDSDIDLDRDSPAITKLFNEARKGTTHGVEWAKLYEEGKSTNAIAEMYGAMTTTISNSLKRQGIEIRHQPTYEEERALWINLFNQGVSVPEIARRRGIQKSTIYRYLKKQGVVFPKGNFIKPGPVDYEWKRLYTE
jgi:transposase